ncbi:hypothetical protein EPUS_07912 [Endocarpon pusillum Z07020]|uniref:AMP-activated protein kinase glycogen-binding domain-containing protein n=1 Tax=Endocarpon pusillum (strain Z07020 / HMAS-L-300199) TaxID=1263415 RepID=U1HPW9_ENDPU|nr:uncharacterized protein EPUS_07912 [Endocarpon pusillum Z07020]ERF72455.1 hypothetical protein EPUS_07912 [Endocarpon pusillum Z07020]
MGTFVFKWPHPEANEVYVTGTFDDWGQTEKLNKVGATFEKEVQLPDASVKILYKFVVDGDWVTDPTAPQEDDGHHNINNILKPEDIKKHGTHAGERVATGVAGAAFLSSAHPDSTSTKLAGQVPKETGKPVPAVEEDVKILAPGAFPETPSNELDSFSVNPIPASSGPGNPVSIPAGEKVPDHEEATGNKVDSKVTTSEEDYEKDASSALPEEKLFSVNPIPPSSGAGNPISLPAGEKPPQHEDITGNKVDSKVTTLEEDYEKDASSALPEEKLFSVNPIPPSSGAGNPISLPAGEKPPQHEEITGNTVDSQVTTSKNDYDKDASSSFPEEKSYGIDPIPASAGIGNPVSVPAGESVQEHKSLLPQSIYATATTSKEDYDKAGSAAMPIGGTGEVPAEANDSAFSVPEKSNDMIPESSLPMSGGVEDTLGTGPLIQSSGPGTTTAALAGQVPLEPKSRAAVVEDDIASSTDAGPFIQSAGPDTTTAALAGQVPLEPKSRAAVVEDDIAGADAFIQSSGPGTTTAALAAEVPIEPKSNATVIDDPTLSAADTGPFVQSSGPGTTGAELAGQVPLEPKSKATVVDDKTNNPGPFIQSSGPGTTAAALAGQVPLEPRSQTTVIEDEAPSATVSGPAPDVPEVVKESLSQAHESPEAAASAEAVREKKEVESELLQEVKSTDAAGVPAPTITAATSATAPSTAPVDSKALEPVKEAENANGKDQAPSRDISPMGRDSDAVAPQPSSPIVTTGVGESKTSTVSTPQKTTTPASSAASSPADANGAKDKKKKRLSFFGKLRDKLKN